MADARADLFDSAQLASRIVDTLIDHRLVARDRRAEAEVSVKWELDAQRGMNRVVLRDPS